MYAIVEIKGKQFRVREDDTLYVPHMQADAGDDVTFDRVLLLANDEDVQIGTPVVSDASIDAEVLQHVKGDKVTVFKKKRRKRYRVKRGHRQQYTEIKIHSLNTNGTPEAPAEESEETVPAEQEEENTDAEAA